MRICSTCSLVLQAECYFVKGLYASGGDGKEESDAQWTCSCIFRYVLSTIVRRTVLGGGEAGSLEEKEEVLCTCQQLCQLSQDCKRTHLWSSGIRHVYHHWQSHKSKKQNLSDQTIVREGDVCKGFHWLTEMPAAIGAQCIAQAAIVWHHPQPVSLWI